MLLLEYAVKDYRYQYVLCKEFKAMDDIGVVMTPFGDVVTVSLQSS